MLGGGLVERKLDVRNWPSQSYTVLQIQLKMLTPKILVVSPDAAIKLLDTRLIGCKKLPRLLRWNKIIEDEDTWKGHLANILVSTTFC